MPAYTFRCQECGLVFTLQYRFSDDLSSVKCPRGHGRVVRVFRPPAIVFKGSGFYATDHRSSSGRNTSRSTGGEKKGNRATATTSTQA